MSDSVQWVDTHRAIEGDIMTMPRIPDIGHMVVDMGIGRQSTVSLKQESIPSFAGMVSELSGQTQIK